MPVTLLRTRLSRQWRRPPFPALGGGAIVAVIAGALAGIRYQVWRQSLSVAIDKMNPDLLYMGEVTRAIHDTGWYFTNPHVGAPFGQQLYDFPQTGESLQVFALRILSHFSSRPFLVINVYYLLGFPALAYVTYLVLHHLRFRFLAAAPVALLYTFLPYHFAHGEGHLFRSTYLSAPIAALLLLWALGWRERFLVDPERPTRGWRALKANLLWPRVIAALALCVFVASFETMTTAFTMTAMAVAALLLTIRRRHVRELVPAAVMIAAMGVTFLILFLPNLRYRHQHGANHSAGARVPSEQQAFGLQPAQMLLPVEDHEFAPFSRFTHKALNKIPVEGENGQALGILGSLGLLALLYGAVAIGLRRRRGTEDPYNRRRLWGDAGLLTLILLIFGTMSGFALILSTIGLSQIRAWDRVVVIIAFFAFVMMAYAIERILGWTATRFRARSVLASSAAGLLLATAVTTFGIWDTRGGTVRSVPNTANVQEASILQRLDAGILDTVGPGGMIFQLPRVAFPEFGPLYGMTDYDEFRPYLWSHDLSFSYGATTGRPDADWEGRVDNDNPALALPGLAGLGFDGVLLDTYGYPGGGAAVEAKLDTALGPPVLHSVGGRWVFWDLRAYVERHHLTARQLHAAAVALIGPGLVAQLPARGS